MVDGWRMNLLPERKQLPAWRILCWVALAAACLAALAVYFHDRALLIASPFAGAAIGGFGLLLNWSQTSLWVRRRASWLLALGALGNIALFLWDLLHQK